MPYSAGVHPIAIARSVQKTGLTYNNFQSPNSPLIHAGQPVSGGPNDTSVGEISLKTGDNALNGEETL